MSEFIHWPEDWPEHYNGDEPCKLAVGPCNCGERHRPGEFVFQDEVLTRYGEPVIEGYHANASRRRCAVCGVMEDEENDACSQHKMWQLQYELKRVKSVMREAHRVLGEVIPADPNDWVQWARWDSVYENAGAAFHILNDVIGD